MATVRALLLKTDSGHVKLMGNLLFMVMQSLARDWAEQSSEYFLLLTRLLSSSGVVLNNCGALLTKQTDTLTMVWESVLRTGHTGLSSVTLEGHLAITRELVLLLSPDRKLKIGCSKGESGVFYNIYAIIDSRMCFATTKRLDRLP